jgi:hypothetical protein
VDEAEAEVERQRRRLDDNCRDIMGLTEDGKGCLPSAPPIPH